MKTAGRSNVLGKVLFVFYVAVILSCIAMPFSAFGADKLVVKDAGGNTKFVATDDGSVGVGTAAPVSRMHVSGGFITVDNTGATGSDAGFSIKNADASFPAAMAVGGVGNPNYLANWNLVNGTQYDPTKISLLMGLAVTSDQITWQRAPAGGVWSKLMVIKGATGNLGVGADTPMQKLEVNGGVRLNTLTPRPTCNDDARGTFWVERDTTNDVVQVCAMTGGSLVWTTLQRL